MNPTLFKIYTIVVIGCGGIGSQLLQALTRYLASIENAPNLVLVDGDKFEENNTNRQEFPEQLLGYNKAQAMEILYNKKTNNKLNIISHEGYIGLENVADIITDNTIVLSCVDNHVCRNILSKQCQKLKDVILISGGNSDKLDGNVQIYVRHNGVDATEPIEKRHPEIATTYDGDRSAMSCEELAKIPGGEQVIFANAFAGLIMNSLMYNFLVNPSGITGVQEVYFDGYSVKTKRIVDGVPE